MKCLSISSNFKKETLLQMFEHLTQLSNSGNKALQICFDLSLAEFDESLSMCYLHPYIQEQIQDTVIDNESELRNLNVFFVVTYSEKRLRIAEEQMEKDSFVDVVGMTIIMQFITEGKIPEDLRKA